MRQSSFDYRGFVAVGHPDVTKNGRVNGNFSIHALSPYGEIVFRTSHMAECETRAEALENMCIVAEAWIDKHLDGKTA